MIRITANNQGYKRDVIKNAKTESQKGPREGNTVRNYLLGFRQISGVHIFTRKTRISTILWKIGIGEMFSKSVSN